MAVTVGRSDHLHDPMMRVPGRNERHGYDLGWPGEWALTSEVDLVRRLHRPLLIAFVAALALAACSSTPSSSTTTTTGSSMADVTFPDAFTPIAIEAISDPTFPWLGTDQKYHVSYDLQLTNGSRLPATLDKVEVVDAYDQTRVVGSLTGAQLVDPNCPYGDCNRLRLLPSSPAPDTTIPSQESRALMIDLTFDTLADAPSAVLHHIYGTGAAGPPAKTPTAINYLAAPFDISAGSPRVIGPPVKGDDWVAANGCCGMGWPHRPSLTSVDGALENSQRFAIDWMKLKDTGVFTSGDKTKNESYASYDQNIYAVADGTVVAILDNVDTNAPGILPANDPVMAAKLTVENVDGNHIILDIGGGSWAMYAHLIPGSMSVKVGDKVKKGDVIAKLGNTGNANAPHMHFQLMNNAIQFRADALPYVIDKFDYVGQVSPQVLDAADDYVTGTIYPPPFPTAQPRTAQLPMALAVVNFPGN
jgi:hypothetical protein